MDTATRLKRYSIKIFPSIELVKISVQKWRADGDIIVLTSGTFDILHVGHGRYLSLAQGYGTRLIVGLDSDNKVSARKGPSRPVVKQDERAEMLSYLEAVDALYIKNLDDPKWQLIVSVRPDVLVISRRSEYTEEDIRELNKYCGSVVVLDSQAETSTSARIRSLIVSSVAPLNAKVTELVEQILAIQADLKDIMGG